MSAKIKTVGKIPNGLPALPAVPDGWHAWKQVPSPKEIQKVNRPMAFYHMRSSQNRETWLRSDPSNKMSVTWGGKSEHEVINIIAVKLPRKKKAKKRFPLVRQFAKTIFNETDSPRLFCDSAARRCMRILDNHQRAMRRKEGK